MPTLLQPRPGVPVSQATADDEHARRMLANLIAMIACLLLIGAGLFVLEGLNQAWKLERCVEAGRGVCPPSEPNPLLHAPSRRTPMILPGISGARP